MFSCVYRFKFVSDGNFAAYVRVPTYHTALKRFFFSIFGHLCSLTGLWESQSAYISPTVRCFFATSISFNVLKILQKSRAPWSSMQTVSLTSENHYLCLSVSPSIVSELAIRKTIADALTEIFGITSTSTYLDVLWVKDDGSECIIRVHKR